MSHARAPSPKGPGGEAWRKIHAASAKIEPRLQRSLIRASHRLAAALDEDKIADIIEEGDVGAVDAYLESIDFVSFYEPASRIVQDAVRKGVKIGA